MMKDFKWIPFLTRVLMTVQFLVFSAYAGAGNLRQEKTESRFGTESFEIDASEFSSIPGLLEDAQTQFETALAQSLATSLFSASVKPRYRVKLVPATSESTSHEPSIEWIDAEQAEVVWPVTQTVARTGMRPALTPLDPSILVRTNENEKAVQMLTDVQSRATMQDKPQVCAATGAQVAAKVVPKKPKKKSEQVTVKPAPTPVLSPTVQEALELGKKLREEQVRRRDCPEGTKANEALKALGLRLYKEGAHKRADITQLYVSKDTLKNPKGHRMGMYCGYNVNWKHVFRGTIHAANPNTLFNQGREGLSINCVKYSRSSVPGEEGVFVQSGEDCEGMRGYREKRGEPDTGRDFVLIPISEGVFIQMYARFSGKGIKNPDIFYTGIVFAPIQK